MNSNIQDFYSDIQFPGHYTKEQLKYHMPVVQNPYLEIIDRYIENYDGNDKTVLDVGCGTGLLSNLYALRHPDCKFTGIDFSDSIEYAEQYAIDNRIKNVEFVKADYVEDEVDKLFDVVICQGVLHHIPEYKYTAGKLMRNVKPGGYLIVGLYHPWGKLLKQWFSLNYKNDILYKDQELNPFELSFTVQETRNLFSGFKLIDSYPAINMATSIKSLLNFRSGGLITYVFKNRN